MDIINKKSLKTKKAIALLLFLLYLGAISLMAQETPRSFIAENTLENISIDGKMNEPYWDILDLSDLELQALANFGETMKFTPIVASRLASVLAASILKKQNEEYEL